MRISHWLQALDVPNGVPFISYKIESGRLSRRSEKCVSMRNPTTIAGIFDGDANVAQCLKYLCRLSIKVENISISGVESRNLRVLIRRLLAVRPDKGKVISIVGLAGSIAGVLIALCATVTSPPWGLLRDLSMLGSLALGGILGCMCGTLIGCVVASVLSSCPPKVRGGRRLAGNQMAIDVQVPEQSPEKDAVRAIMEKFGAVVTVKGQGVPTPKNVSPPSVSPR